MDNIERGQVTNSAAEIYDAFFVPALFEEWPQHLIRAAGINDAADVLDVACGTGVLARAVRQQVGQAGRVVGIDINPSMLAVARSRSTNIEWYEGSAEDLPFVTSEFDSVVSQFGLMFFADRRRALREMVRILRHGGRLAIAVWASLEATPGYAAMVRLLARLFGDDTAEGLRAPYVLGNRDQLAGLFEGLQLVGLQIETRLGHAQFPSVEAWVHTDIKGWTLADAIDDVQFGVLLAQAKNDLAQFVQPDGSVRFDAPAHIVSARKRT